MTEVISVRFRGGCKTYYFDPRGVQVTAGEHVIVETAQGLEYAQCAEGNHEVPDEQVVEPFRPMVRIATDHDRRVLERNRAREKEAFDVCQKKILQHGWSAVLTATRSCSSSPPMAGWTSGSW